MKVLTDTLRFLAYTIPVIALASFLVSYSINKGILERMSSKIEPLLSKLNLDQITVASVAVCFVSPTAAYSMLSQALKEKKINEREVIAASFLNSFPATFSHIYSFFIPFVIPILGWAGVLYTALRMIVAIAKSAIGFVLALKWKTRREFVKRKIVRRRVDPLKSTWKTIKRVTPIMTATYLAVSLLSAYGFFEYFKEIFKFLPFDPNVITISAVEFVNVRAAVVLAAGMLERGILAPKWVVVGLILGNVITLSTRFVKHSLPLHLSLFGRLGVKIVVLNALATLILDFIIIMLVVSFL